MKSERNQPMSKRRERQQEEQRVKKKEEEEGEVVKRGEDKQKKKKNANNNMDSRLVSHDSTSISLSGFDFLVRYEARYIPDGMIVGDEKSKVHAIYSLVLLSCMLIKPNIGRYRDADRHRQIHISTDKYRDT